MLNKVFLLSAKKPINKSKSIKKRIFSTKNVIIPSEKQKSPSFYQKIYSITPDSLNNSKEEKNQNKTLKKKSVSLKNIFKKPKFLSTPFQFKKITDPKSPFSKRTIEPKEQRDNRIKLKKPSQIFHNFETIQWLRKKFSENILNKSIYTLLPNNGKPVIPENETEENKRHRKMMEYLEKLKEPIGREKFVSINPKYFFNRTTFELVLKLKKIFLEFDADGNRRMELDEMLEMFESNKISANINDLVELFFKGKKFKEKEVLKLYLNFHQFINFALTKDQDFRQFMRNIKERAEKEKIKAKKNMGIMGGKKNNPDEEKDGYLPMSFKSLLDYFIDKGKERSSKEIINNAIKEMNDIINKNKTSTTNHNVNKKFITQKTFKINDSESSKNLSKKKPIVSKKTLQPKTYSNLYINDGRQVTRASSRKRNKFFEEDLEKLNIELNLNDDYDFDYEKQLKDINFQKLIDEFSNLFNVNQIHSNRQNKNNISNIKIKKISENNNNNIDNKINNSENIKIKNGKSMQKSCSQTLLNSLSTRSQENIKNNLIYSAKEDYTNTFYKPHGYEFSKKKDFKIFNKKNKLQSAQNVSNCYKNYINENGKIQFFKLENDNTRNKSSYRYIQNVPKEKKLRFVNTFTKSTKSQSELPQVNNIFYEKSHKLKKTRSAETIISYPLRNRKKSLERNEHFFPNTQMNRSKIKYNFINDSFNNRNKKDKYFINYYGGKINLIKKNTESFSDSKFDYVPLKLLSNPKNTTQSSFYTIRKIH